MKKLSKDEKIIEIVNVSKVFSETVAVDNVSLYVRKGEFITFLGPSGCGKTTTLRMIAGFDLPSSGKILLNGKDITDLPPNKRPVNTVFQRYALFPHYNIYDNIAFGLKLKKTPVTYVNDAGESYTKLQKLTRKEIDEKVKNALAVVDLEGFEKRSVSTLSGGQQQRVAIARALALNPDILCFDEPTSALDPELTGEVLKVIKGLKSSDSTMIVVTHEMEFARNVADLVIFMADGVIEEMGTPAEVFDFPKSDKTRAFLQKSLEQTL